MIYKVTVGFGENDDMDEDKNGAVYSSAQLKGRRLRMVRILSGLTRQELYEKMHISPSTMNTWETGRVELTEVGAGRVCAAFSKIGILCTKEWLLNGAGAPPRVMSAVERSIFSENSNDEIEMQHTRLAQKSPQTQQEQNIENLKLPWDAEGELRYFVRNHAQALFHLVGENFMNARYRVGDCVAGAAASSPENLLGCTVIIRKDDGGTVLGKLISYNDGVCEIFCDMKSAHKIIKSNAVAEVIWHRMLSRRKQ